MAGDSYGRAKRHATAAAALCHSIPRGSGTFRAKRPSFSPLMAKTRMSEVIRVSRDENPVTEVPREWLVTNGLGGYASATISGAITRRHHGFLIAALPPPLGRMMVLNDFDVEIESADGTVANLREPARFIDFTLKMGLPSWRHEIDGMVIEKSIVLPSGHNIVHVTFRLLGGGHQARLRLRPFINFRALDAPVGDALAFEGERRRRLVGLAAAPAQSGFGAELVLAADTFVITPVGRIADVARA